MIILILIVFACVWYLPLLRKHKKTTREPARYYVFAFLAGVLSLILTLILQFAYAYGIVYTGLREKAGWLSLILTYFISVALVEEMSKYFCGRLVVRKGTHLTEAGCMLLMGMTGMGFEMAESFMASDGILPAVFRGLTMLHIFYQLWMGKYCWRAQQAKLAGDKAGYNKNLWIALLVPIFLHFSFDYIITIAESIFDIEEKTGESMLLLLLAMVEAIVTIVIVLRSAHKTLKEEAQRAAVEAAAVVE